VAYANGANDNFKGVATLWGSGTVNYRKALIWATVTTLAGSLTAFFWGSQLMKTFSGKGLVPDALIASPDFLPAVALGAGLTVLVTALLGIPISTTHSLTGALAGAGFMAIGSDLGTAALRGNFFTPLVISPLAAVIMTMMIYPLFRLARKNLGVNKNTCFCLEQQVISAGCPGIIKGGVLYSVAELHSLGIVVDAKEHCQARAVERYTGRVMGVDAQQILDVAHFLSAGAVSFARGLNDTPKIVALAVVSGVAGLKVNILAVALVMALGGICNARKIAETMSYRITGMNHGQGFTANLVTAFLVIFASKWGVPVSTTHVSCGSLLGLLRNSA
jgi:PiT family inorganic phosphate transporter